MTDAVNKDVSELIVEIVDSAEDGLSSADIYAQLKQNYPANTPVYRTVGRKLLALVKEGEIVRSGKARAVKYRPHGATPVLNDAKQSIPISDESKAVQDYVRRPIQERVSRVTQNSPVVVIENSPPMV